MPWLEILTIHGREKISILFDNPHQKIFREWRPVQYVQISDDLAKLSIDALKETYQQHKRGQDEKIRAASEIASKKNALVERLAEIIRTSNQIGERSNAKSLYEKITGQPYTGPEFQS